MYNQNDTSKPAKSTFESEVSGTVGIDVTVSQKFNANVFLAAAESAYSISLSASLTAKVGNKISFTTPAKSGTYGAFGVWRQKITGRQYYIYSNCDTGQSTTYTAHAPRSVGWRIWE